MMKQSDPLVGVAYIKCFESLGWAWRTFALSILSFCGPYGRRRNNEKLELWIKFVYFVMFMSLSLAFPSFILCNCLYLYYAFFFYFSVLWRIITICLVGCGTFEHALHKLSNSMKDTTTLKSTANNKKKKISFEIVTNEVSTSAPLIKSQIHNIQMKMDRHKFKRKKSAVLFIFLSGSSNLRPSNTKLSMKKMREPKKK